MLQPANVISAIRKIRADQWVFWAMIAVILCTYHLYANFDPRHFTSNYYHDQSLGFLSGHTWMSHKADPAFTCFTDPYGDPQAEPYWLQDYVYYDGHFYMYFGPVPALLLWIPINLITGATVHDGVLTYIFSTIGTCCLCLMIYLIALRNQIADAKGLLMVIPCVAFGTWVLFILREPFVYEAAIAGAYGCASIAALCMWFFMDKGRYRWLAAASLWFGLAVGCRIIYAFDGAILAAAFFYALSRPKKPSFIKTALYAFAPWGACGLALAIFNYARFGNPFEIGVHYMHDNIANLHDPSFRFIIPEFYREKLYFYLLHPVSWYTHFPDFHSTYVISTWSTVHHSLWYQEALYGNWSNSPFSLFFVLFLLDWRTRKWFAPNLRFFLNGLSLCFLAIFSFLLVYFFFSARYQVDFAPWTMAIGGIYYLKLLQKTKKPIYRKCLLATGAMLTILTVAIGAAAGYCGYYHCP